MMTSTRAEQVPLSQFTTLAVGGPAREMVRVDTVAEALAQAGRARQLGWPLFVLGGGSNLLVSDEGFPGLVLQWDDRSLELLESRDSTVLCKVGGGWSWDEWVSHTVEQNWAGLECLSGIPGRVGAAPIQNIGAYGREVAECIEACWVLDWQTGVIERLPAADCGFGYRYSHFKGPWKGRFLLTAVEFRLQIQGIPQVRYAELQRAMEGQPLDLAQVRQTVLGIRRGKSMVWDPSDPNHRSAGSFFMNPLVPAERARQLRQQWGEAMPAYPAGEEMYKLSAAWLIERSGFPRGFVQGAAGLSSRHVLALINRGSARAEDMLRLAARVRRGVLEQFAIELVPEPEFLGFSESVAELLSKFS